jgi:hypothetical protein
VSWWYFPYTFQQWLVRKKGRDMFCSKCGTKIEDDSNFCRVCGAPQKAGTPSRQPVVEVCQIERRHRQTKGSEWLLMTLRYDVWYAARISTKEVASSSVVHDIRNAGSFYNDPLVDDDVDLELRQELIQALLLDGWKPSVYDQDGKVVAMERQKAG